MVRSVLSFAAGALVVLALSSSVGAAGGDESIQSFDQSLLSVANRLDAAATAARLKPNGRASIPHLRLPAAPLATTSVSIDQWLQSQLQRVRQEKSSKTQAHELAQLAASVRSAAQATQSAAPALDPRAASAAILAQRSYQTGGAGPAPQPRKSLLETVLGWLGERISDLLTRIFGATASLPIVGQIVTVLYIGLVAALAAYLIYLLVSLIIRRRRPSSQNEGTPLPERSDPDVLYELGMAAANQGHYARAVSLLFQASLAAFDRSGSLPLDESLTAGEYRRAVRRKVSAASPYFDDIARTFVLAAFAERPISKHDFATADAAYRSLRPLLAS